MRGTARALNDGPWAKSSVWDSDRFKDISHSPIANSGTHIAKRQTTVIAPFMGRCAAAFHQIIDFPPFGGVCTNYSMTKCTGWVLLPATIRCPFEPTRTAPHRHHARPLGGNALLVASSAVRTTCPLACEHLRLATVSNRAVAG